MRRGGATLIEVLVAIFVMGIGLIALLVLFPLGALRMADAIQNDYCARTAATADAVITMQSIRTDPLVRNDGVSDVFVNPCAIEGSPAYGSADPSGPSYPVLVDPVGWRAAGGLNWVGGTQYSGIRRRPVSFATTDPEVHRWFTLLDDINFDTDGLPKAIVAGLPPTIERDLRYSWAVLCQRPRSSDPASMSCTVIVYNRRPLLPNGLLTLNEFVYSRDYDPTRDATFDTSRNVITVMYGNAPPPVRPGDWVLDSTPKAFSGGVLSPHAFFYRVVSVVEINPTQLELEVQTPLRGFPSGSVTSGTLVICEGIAEVFERGLGKNRN